MLKTTLVLITVFSLVFSCGACTPHMINNPSPKPTIKEGLGSIQEFTSSNQESESMEPIRETPPAVLSPNSSQSKSASPTNDASSAVTGQSTSAQESSSGHSRSTSGSESDISQSLSSQVGLENTSSTSRSQSGSTIEQPTTSSDVELRGVWISYLELGSMLTDQTASQYRNNIRTACQNAVNLGLNTIFFQVRPFGDAIYPSAYFPQSYLFNGTEGKLNSAPFDALAIAIEEAHNVGLRLEAWVNPYRIRSAYATRPMSADNPAQDYLAQGEDVVIRRGNIISYNPGSIKAQEHIVNGIQELVENYELDGIHFDDYFYPTTDADFDQNTYAASGSDLSLAAWRRQNVTTLMGKVHQVAKEAGVPFGISPQGNNSNNLNSQYVDVKEIAHQGYADYICPQMYFGYKNNISPYASTIEEFNRMVAGTGVKLYIGLATYKFGKEDTWAGNGKSEWIGTTDLIARQVQTARALSEYAGFSLYRYDCIFNSDSFYTGTTRTQVKTEMANLQAILE